MDHMMHDQLLSKLVGIARATDGNEHLINAGATAAIAEGLCLLENGDDCKVRKVMERIQVEKRNMIPDCFLCASPCGKNADLDLSQLLSDPPDVSGMKQDILSAACMLARDIRPPYPQTAERALYTALIAFGMEGISSHQLREIMDLLSLKML